LFVPEDYPGREAFDALTKAEISLGLLEEGQDIGLQKQWNETLARKGVRLEGHLIVAD
jgi:hypothetical protein